MVSDALVLVIDGEQRCNIVLISVIRIPLRRCRARGPAPQSPLAVLPLWTESRSLREQRETFARNSSSCVMCSTFDIPAAHLHQTVVAPSSRVVLHIIRRSRRLPTCADPCGRLSKVSLQGNMGVHLIHTCIYRRNNSPSSPPSTRIPKKFLLPKEKHQVSDKDSIYL